MKTIKMKKSTLSVFKIGNLIHTAFSIEFIVSLLLTGYVTYQFLETGLEVLLVIVLLLSALRLRSRPFSKLSLTSGLLIFFAILPTYITGGGLFGTKILLYVLTATSVARARLFVPSLFLCAMVVQVFLYFCFFSEHYNKFDNLPFFVFAPNYFVFLIVFPLLAINSSPFVVALLSVFSLSRWNFVSVLSSYSRILSAFVLLGAFANLTVGAVDTTLGLKESSDGDRLNLLLFQVKTADEYIIGKPVEKIRDDIASRVEFTTDTFEGILFDAYSLFGIFGLSIFIYHSRIFKKRVINANKTAALYLFLYSFFNPVIYSFSYFLFAEYLLRDAEGHLVFLKR